MEHQTLGGYEVGRKLGTGATAAVHEARRSSDGEVVALKILHSTHWKRPDLVARFRKEAETLQEIEHPNIVRTLDFFESPPHLVYVMERLSGSTMERILKDGAPFDAKQCLEWALQICDGLEVVHRMKVVHRDIKPSNIFMDRRGRLVLADFGMARDKEEKITRADQRVLGTPLYMAPEQLLGRTSTPATDVYQFALVLYEMATGELPFDGTNAFAKMMARTERDLFVPLHQEMDPSLREILRRAGFQRPERRYPDAGVMKQDVLAALEERPLPFRPPDPKKERVGTLTTMGLDWKDPQNYRGTLLVCPRINLRFDPVEKAFHIGSQPASEVCLKELNILDRHLRLSPQEDESWSLECLGDPTGVTLAGLPYDGAPTRIWHGAILGIQGMELLWVNHPEILAQEHVRRPKSGIMQRSILVGDAALVEEPPPALPEAKGCAAKLSALGIGLVGLGSFAYTLLSGLGGWLPGALG